MRPNTSSALGYGHIPEGSKAAITTATALRGHHGPWPSRFTGSAARNADSRSTLPASGHNRKRCCYAPWARAATVTTYTPAGTSKSASKTLGACDLLS